MQCRQRAGLRCRVLHSQTSWRPASTPHPPSRSSTRSSKRPRASGARKHRARRSVTASGLAGRRGSGGRPCGAWPTTEVLEGRKCEHVYACGVCAWRTRPAPVRNFAAAAAHSGCVSVRSREMDGTCVLSWMTEGPGLSLTGGRPHPLRVGCGNGNCGETELPYEAKKKSDRVGHSADGDGAAGCAGGSAVGLLRQCRPPISPCVHLSYMYPYPPFISIPIPFPIHVPIPICLCGQKTRTRVLSHKLPTHTAARSRRAWGPPRCAFTCNASFTPPLPTSMGCHPRASRCRPVPRVVGLQNILRS